MLINLRNALMAGKRLPYDAEVEYLESSGTQWIDTGVPLKFPISAEMTLAMISPYGTLDSLPVFGFRYGGGSASSKFAIWFSKSQLRFALNYGSYDSSWKGSSVQSGQEVHLRTDMAKLYIDGVLVADGGTVTTSDASNTLTLFQMRDTSSVANRGQCVRYYSCKLYDANGTLVRDYIPVRKGTVGYLYDRVSGKLFGNAGSGDFVLGPDVVPVEYIESHGTEWIDTGYKAGSAPGIDITFSLSTLGTQVIFGGRNDVFSRRFALFNLNGGWRLDAYEQPSLGIAADTSSVFQFTYGNNTAMIRNTTVGTSASVTVSPSSIGQYDIALFAINTAGTISLNMNGRIYACKNYESGVLVRDYKSIRVGTEGAMMDVLTRRIYRNAGTGAFTYGNDLKYPIPAE